MVKGGKTMKKSKMNFKNNIAIKKQLTKSNINYCKEDRIFHLVTTILITIILLVVLYPLIYIVSSSFSSPAAVSAGKVVLFPVDFSLEGYKAVFKNQDILSGYGNSIFYTIVGTLINVVITLLAAYPLSRRTLPGKGAISFIFTFTMFFSGGMIPSYILIRDLGIMNTMWAMVLPGALSVYNMIITKTFLQTSIPGEMLEAAQIDGCNDIQYFLKIVLPLAKPVIAVITLFYAVEHWNSYFNAFLYLTDRELYPLQIILREILIVNSIDPSMIVDEELLQAKQGIAELLKYSLIIVSVVPMLVIYPFIQKYFAKGMMIGSVKG